MSLKSRARIRAMMAKIMGFNFEEKELPPRLRKELGDIAETLDYYYHLKDRKSKSEDSWGGSCFGFFVSLIATILFVLGLRIWVRWAYYLGLRWPIAEVAVGGFLVFLILLTLCFHFLSNAEQSTLEQIRKETASYWSRINNQVENLAGKAYNEMSLVHEAKVRPTVKHVVIDFASIIRAARGRGIILNVIECPYCRGAVEIPESGEYFKCKYCGKTIYATKIFDKIKDMLKE